MRRAWSTGFPSRKLSRLAGGVIVLALVAGLQPATAAAEPRPAGQMTVGEHLEVLASYGGSYQARLRPEVAARLSSGGQQLVTLAEMGSEIEQLAAAAQAMPKTSRVRPQGPRITRPGLANDAFAAEDLFSRLTGMTQNETSAAWCGSNAVIGFNDSGSFVSTAFLALSPSGSVSLNGWSQSTDSGRRYTDRGALIADPIPPDLAVRDLLGDPVIGCTSERNFYYASLAFDLSADGSSADSGISVSRSTDGGTSFGPAAMAASKDADLHFLDKPWLAVEPGATSSPSDDVLHVSYTDFDFSGFEEQGPCPGEGRTAIEYVRSTDGGTTWSPPLVLDEVCDRDGFLQGSQVDVGVGDDVYVAWEAYPPDPTTIRELRIRRSTDLGAGFGATVPVTPVTSIGDSFGLQGNFRAFLDLQGLAVDQTSGSRQGTVYLTFQDGSARQKPDPLGLCGGTATYCFGDVYLVSSTDGGGTWSAPVRINDDDIRLGIDQWFPAVAVDRSGTVWVAYHDRRRDSRNFMIDTFVARSRDGGARWTQQRATRASFPPIVGQDLIINPFYMGDYITVAADATGRSAGVIVAWGDNSLGDANVVQRRFRR